MSQHEMNSDKPIDQYRRRLLGGTVAAMAGLSIAPGVFLQTVQARPADEPVSDKNRWGLLIDTNKCADGCNKCVTACNEENGLKPMHGPETDPQWIRIVKVKSKSTGHQFQMPVMCQHCAHPPCQDVCPTGASFKREDGIVLVDRHICIGCRYCMMACPYKARSLVHENLTDQKPYMPRGKGTVEACTLCVHKVDRGDGTTACAESCPEQAIVFGDLNDGNSEISRRLEQHGGRQLRADLSLDTGVRYQGL